MAKHYDFDDEYDDDFEDRKNRNKGKNHRRSKRNTSMKHAWLENLGECDDYGYSNVDRRSNRQ